MNIRTISITVAAVVILSFSISALGWWPFSNKDDAAAKQGGITELVWEDLIPDDFEQPKNPFNEMSQEEIDKLMDGSSESNAELARLKAEFHYAPVVDELDGKRVKIPAYVTPLEFKENATLKEFLLVPYMGACIHSPPPPANQIVHANSPEAIKFENMYDPVWAVGVIRTETVKSDLAESGYRLEVEEVLPYESE